MIASESRSNSISEEGIDDDSKENERGTVIRRTIFENDVQKMATTGVDVGSVGQPDRYLFTSTMDPWVRRQLWRALKVHVFPLFMILWYYDWPEHHAFFLKMRHREFTDFPYQKLFLMLHGHVVPITLFIGVTLSIFMYSHPPFNVCPHEHFVGMHVTDYCAGSIIMGINSYVDVFKDLYFIPIFSFFSHKILIACKYASLSASEYCAYVNEKDETLRLRNLRLLNMLSNKNDEQFTRHEAEMALIKASNGIDGRVEFYINIPQKEKSQAALNFKNWQALLLGKTHHHGITWREIHPSLTKLMFRRKVENGDGAKECYVVDVHHVLTAIMRWSDKINYDYDYHVKVSRCTSYIVALIPLLSLFAIVDTRTFFANRANSLIFITTLLSFAFVTFMILPPLLQYVVFVYVYYQKKAIRAALLEDMLRSNDLDPQNKLYKVGITPSQRAIVHDVVEVNEKMLDLIKGTSGKGSQTKADHPKMEDAMEVKSKRNPNVARMPSIAYFGEPENAEETLLGHTNNILSWTILRTCTKEIYSRSETRLQIACSLNMWMCVFLAAVLLYGYLRTIFSDLNPSETSTGDIFISSPISIQILCMICFITFYTGLALLAGTDVNAREESHYLCMKSIMNRIQRLIDMSEGSARAGVAKCRTYREKLQRIAHAYMRSYKYVTSLDSIRYTKLFGVGITMNLVTFYGTVIGSAASGLSATWITMMSIEKY